MTDKQQIEKLFSEIAKKDAEFQNLRLKASEILRRIRITSALVQDLENNLNRNSKETIDNEAV